MENETIVQFVGFSTKLSTEDFVNIWEVYARQLAGINNQITLMKLVPGLYNHQIKFKYISKHKYRNAEFNFVFMKASGNMQFPEHNARIVQVGGYIPVSLGSEIQKVAAEIKVVAFLAKGGTNWDHLRMLPYASLDIYQAYFENCAYEFVLEFFLQEPDLISLIKQLQSVPEIEIGLMEQVPIHELFEKA
jgi:hypothetical protein